MNLQETDYGESFVNETVLTSTIIENKALTKLVVGKFNTRIFLYIFILTIFYILIYTTI